MRVATSTNLFGHNREKTKYTSSFESIERCNKAGFRVLDMNFCPMNQGNFTEFCGEDYLEQAHQIRELAERLGVTFSQSHIPFAAGYLPQNTNADPEAVQRLLEYSKRAILVGEILGVKWAVVHPYTDTNSEHDNEANLKFNLEYYKPIVEMLQKHGQGMAIENLFTLPSDKRRRRYCDIVEEQVELIDKFGDASVGACWDFGHGHLMYEDQTIPLRKLGGRLKATHVDDNRKQFDAHLLPFTGGSIKWEDLMPVLAEIRYKGDFTYEIHGYTQNLPDEFRDAAARFSYDVGEYCIRLAQK